MTGAGTELTRTLREGIRHSKEMDAEEAAKDAAKRGDTVAAAHHAARARAFANSYRNPDAQAEVDQEATDQLREALSHPDPAVRESARQGLEDFGVYAR